jgi:T5SS/PEP-CTERM-associated repeat protein
MKIIRGFLTVSVCVGLSSIAARAENFTTNIVDGVSSNAATVIVGNGGTFNYLEINNGGSLTNISATIGVNSGSNIGKLNTVLVDGSLWTNATSLLIGDSGPTNQLTIADGGTVKCNLANLGSTTGSGGNIVFITSAAWEIATELKIGVSSTGNQLVITNGASVSDQFGYIGYNSLGRGNTVLVSDGASWDSVNDLHVGRSGGGNQLTISAGAEASADNGYIGFNSSATNNAVTVTGLGSIWSMGTALVIGRQGGTNSLTISDGGEVDSDSSTIGSNSAANVVLVTNSLWYNASDLIIGRSGANNHLTVADASEVDSTSGTIGSNSAANVVLVTGANSVWNNASDLIIGRSGGGNQLTISAGAQASADNGYIGFSSSASQNAVLVTGANSVWGNAGDLIIGRSGANNHLTVADAGELDSASGTIGSNSAANVVLVTGANSVWNNAGDLIIGRSGANNQLTVADAGELDSASGTIGSNSAANVVLVTGANSVWNNATDLVIGLWGGGNQLTIGAGAQISADNGYIGFHSTAPSNGVTVTDANSLWSNNSDLTIGRSGGGNQLTISAGAQVSADNGYIGSNVTATGNAVLVTGANSLWYNAGDLIIGQLGANNRLTVADAGEVDAFSAIVGNNSTANAVIVTGTNSTWFITDSVTVGFVFGGNRVTVTNAAQVGTADTLIGLGTGSSNNVVAITSTGTLWAATGQIVIGVAGSSNSLTVANGAELDSVGGVIGNNSTRNVMAITGSGSLWDITGDLAVGLSRGTNQLIISDGELDAANIVVGAASAINRATLTKGTISATLLTINTNNLLTGCGTIDSDVINFGVISNNCGRLDVTGVVTNNGTIISANGSFLAFDNFVVNNGTITTTNGGVTFFGGIDNHGTVLLDPNGSAVGDGIQNGWKQKFGFDPFDPTVANTDSDGDGFGNLQEFLAATDPTNSASYFHVTSVVRTGSDVRVTWMMGPGKTNALQFASGASFTNSFADLFVVTNTVGTVTSFLDVGAATNTPARYYRVRIVP